jgi:hypothetical protein
MMIPIRYGQSFDNPSSSSLEKGGISIRAEFLTAFKRRRRVEEAPFRHQEDNPEVSGLFSEYLKE